MMTEFIVVRHGETEANLQGILQGQSDTELNPLGIRQAELVAERLKKEHFDLIFSSDLSRTMNTARLIAEPH
ncbi:MAG: histidine phosphatase family protein, partial [Lentisphaeria bacterium]|nr:histidine phosphatase family protein [Lentisphaeria bacterium]